MRVFVGGHRLLHNTAEVPSGALHRASWWRGPSSPQAGTETPANVTQDDLSTEGSTQGLQKVSSSITIPVGYASKQEQCVHVLRRPHSSTDHTHS